MKAFLLLAFCLLVTHHEKGQCADQGSYNEDSSSSIMAEIQPMIVEEIRRQLNEQVQGLHEILHKLHEKMKYQLETIATSLQTVDQRSQEQLQCMKNLSASFQQMKYQQDTVLTSLHAVGRRSQEQDIYITYFQSIQSLLNESFEQMKAQHDVVLRNLEANDQHLNEHDIFIKNESKNSFKLAIAFGIDLGEGPIPLSTVNEWVVIMHRFDGSLNFNRSWTEYKNGFGDIGRGEFWLGNEKIHRLTNRLIYTLHIEVQSNATGAWYCADYSTFSLDSEANKYALRLSGFSGNAGDSLTNNSLRSDWYLGGMGFSTWDTDNDMWSDGNCANYFNGGGWWYNRCHATCLTCLYNKNVFRWYNIGHSSEVYPDRLRAARMMIRSI